MLPQPTDSPDPAPGLPPSAYQMVFEQSPVAIGLADEHGRFLAVNPALCTLFGRERSALIGRTSMAFTHPEDRAAHGAAGALVDAAADGVSRVEKRYVHPDGTIRWAWLSVTHVSGPLGQVWTVAHMQDVTERKEAEQALRESEAMLRAVASVMQRIQSGDDVRPSIVAAAVDLGVAEAAILFEPDAHSEHLVVSAASHPELVGTSVPLNSDLPAARCHGTASAAILSQHSPIGRVFPPLDSGDSLNSALLIPVTVQNRSVAVLQVGWSMPGTRRDRSHSLQVLSILADQAAVALHQVRLLADLQQLAGTDPLTGLPNRRSWDLSLPVLMAEAARTGRHLVVALADLDRFKEFNDQFGHLAGDRLIREFAGRMKKLILDADVVARWGGEEFAVALLLDDQQEPRPMLERLRRSVPSGRTSSIGFAKWDGTESAQELMERADQALYRAKAAGRDQTIGTAIGFVIPGQARLPGDELGPTDPRHPPTSRPRNFPPPPSDIPPQRSA